MNTIGYVIKSDNYRSEFARGFLNRSLNMIANVIGGAVPPWKASSLYDDKLNETAAMIAVGRQNFSDEARLKELWEKISDLLAKCGAVCLVIEGIPLPESEAMDLPVFDGTKAALCYQYAKSRIPGEFGRFSDVALMISVETDPAWLEFFADECNYLKIYCRDRSTSLWALDTVYAYNGTAAEGTASIASLSESGAVFCLSESLAPTARHLKAKCVVNPYDRGILESKALKSKVYTDKLGELYLGPAYMEALYYLKTGLLPTSNIRRFMAQVEEDFLSKRN
ncbi:MAG: hypothetical protein LBC69_01845 [Eubacteriaceae bacterium]|nr:hypothetical protein [Eubacteriaceae bacterium]